MQRSATQLSWHWTEPLPQPVLQPGDRILSPGATFTYEILSGPFCRLFPEGSCLTPNANESAWQQTANGQWRKAKGGNHLSYEVRIAGVDTSRPFTLTVRWRVT